MDFGSFAAGRQNEWNTEEGNAMKRIVAGALLLGALLALPVAFGAAQDAPAAERVGDSEFVFVQEEADNMWVEPAKTRHSAPPAAEWAGETQTDWTDDMGQEALTEGETSPGAFWNLAVEAYTAQAEIAQEVCTSRYFCANAQGELYVDVAFTGLADGASATVLLCDRDGSPLRIAYQTAACADGGLYTGRIRFYDLDPNGFYAFRFGKTPDTMPAQVRARISHD